MYLLLSVVMPCYPEPSADYHLCSRPHSNFTVRGACLCVFLSVCLRVTGRPHVSMPGAAGSTLELRLSSFLSVFCACKLFFKQFFNGIRVINRRVSVKGKERGSRNVGGNMNFPSLCTDFISSASYAANVLVCRQSFCVLHYCCKADC